LRQPGPAQDRAVSAVVANVVAKKPRRWLPRIALALLAIVLVPLLDELVIQLVGDPREEEMIAEAKQLPAYWGLARDGVLVHDDRALRFRLKPGFDVAV